MAKEFEKVFLEVDSAFKLDSKLFGKEWDKVREAQIKFILERPLMFKVLTEKFWGPQKLINLWTDEWWEAEKELRASNKVRQTEELADVSLLLLTLDSFNPKLSLPTQISLIGMVWKDVVGGYCEDLGVETKDLVPIAENKIRTNELRNPKEAFALVPSEDMQTSKKRMEENWEALKLKRNNPPGLFVKKKDLWKQWLIVDEGGRLKEIKH